MTDINLKSLEDKILREESLDTILVSKFNIDASTARNMVHNIDFSTYLELQHALDSEDLSTAASLLGIQQEETNPYTLAKSADKLGDPLSQSSPGDEEPLPLDGLDIGDEVGTDKGPAKITKVNSIGPETIYSTNKGTEITTSDMPGIDITDPESAEDEIERIKQLAGIEEAGTMKGGAIASAAMSGTTLSKRKIDKLTHKDMKPGPKPGKKSKSSK